MKNKLQPGDLFKYDIPRYPVVLYIFNKETEKPSFFVYAKLNPTYNPVLMYIKDVIVAGDRYQKVLHNGKIYYAVVHTPSFTLPPSVLCPKTEKTYHIPV
jgi:hypothetical protein